MNAFIESAIEREIIYAERKHPGPQNLLLAISEEVGELHQAVLDGKTGDEIFSEAIQVIATAIRFIKQGDRHHRYEFDEDHYYIMRDIRHHGIKAG